MSMQGRMTKAQLQQGSGKGSGVADEHFRELVGSSDFYVYVAPHTKAKGYEVLKTYLETRGCEVRVSDDAPLLPGKGYKALKITAGGGTIPDEALRQSHRWAHQRNYLHSFFKPYKTSH